MPAAASRLLVSGYYGFGNFGDDAILRIFIDEWRRRRPDDGLTVLSARPETTASAYGVQALARMDWSVVRRAIRDADVVVSGGGGLLQSATSLRSLLYYTRIIEEAERAHRRAAIWAQGIGPLGFFGRQVVKRRCGGVELACVRDEASLNLLRSLLPGVDVRLTADPVFLAPEDPRAVAEQQLQRNGLGETRDLIAVIVRRGRVLKRLMGVLSSLVDRLADRFGAQVVFVPLQTPSDAEAAAAVIRRCRTAPVLLSGGYDLPVMTALARRCAAIISMRLHALILAARLGVPFVAVPHDPKISALCAALGYPIPVLGRATNAVALADKLWGEREALRDHLRRTVPTQVQRALRAFDWLEALVASGGDAARA